MKWRLYYDDGSTFDSSQGAPEDSPGKRGVEGIIVPDATVGRQILTADYYWWDHGIWFCGDQYGCFDYLSRPGLKVVRFGRSMLNAEWQKLWQRMVDDPDFPIKNATRRGERVP